MWDGGCGVYSSLNRVCTCGPLGMAVGSDRVREYGVLGGCIPLRRCRRHYCTQLTRRQHHMPHTKPNTHMLGTHPLTDRLSKAPRQWEALVWIHVAGHSQEEGSSMLLLEPILSSDHPRAPIRPSDQLYRGEVTGSGPHREFGVCRVWKLKLLPFTLVFTSQEHEVCEWARG